MKNNSTFPLLRLGALLVTTFLLSCGGSTNETEEQASGIAPESVELTAVQKTALSQQQPVQERAFAEMAFPSGNVSAEFRNMRLSKRDAVSMSLNNTADFDGDGSADVTWTAASGDTIVSTMRSTSVMGCYNLGNVPEALAGSGDFDGDGKADMVWRNRSTGAVRISLMSGGAVKQWLNVGVAPIPLNVKLEGVGDFDGNGRADMLWRNQSTGRSVMSYHNADGSVASWPVVSNFINPANTTALKVGDINGDGKDDIVWRNMGTGNVVVSIMNGNIPVWRGITVSPISPTVALEAIGDFDGNGKGDLLWRNTSTGRSLMSYHNEDGSVASWPVVSNYINPASTSAVGVGDFDGDGKTDIFWRNLATGNSVISLMNGNVPSWQGASFSACPGPESQALKGRFIDAPVSGVKYQSSGRGGVTDATGAFFYDTPGELITFSVGPLTLGATRANPQVHVFGLEGTLQDAANNRNQQVAQLLQSLDVNGGRESVIQLPSNIHRGNSGIGVVRFGVPQLQFDQNLSGFLNASYPTHAVVPLATASASAASQLAQTLADCPVRAPTPIQQYGSSTQIPLGDLTCADRARMQYHRYVLSPRLSDSQAANQEHAAVVEEFWSPEAAERAIDLNPVISSLQMIDAMSDLESDEDKKKAVVLATKSAELILKNVETWVTGYLTVMPPEPENAEKVQKVMELTNKIFDVVSNNVLCLAAFRGETKNFEPCAKEVISLLEAYAAYYDMKPLASSAMADKLEFLANSIGALIETSKLGSARGKDVARQGFAIANKVVQSTSNMVAIAYYNNHGETPLEGPARVATVAMDNLVSPLLTLGEACYGAGKDPVQKTKCVSATMQEGGKLAIRGVFNAIGTVNSIRYVGQTNSVLVAREVLDELLSAGRMGVANTYARYASHGAVFAATSDPFQQREQLKSLVVAVGQKVHGFDPVEGWFGWAQAIASMTLGGLQFNVIDSLRMVEDGLSDIEINASTNFQSAALDMAVTSTVLGEVTLNMTVIPQNSGITAGYVQCYSTDSLNYQRSSAWTAVINGGSSHQATFLYNKSTVASIHCSIYNTANLFKGSRAVSFTAGALTAATSKLPHTGITANQCYAAGSNALVSCSSAEAVALSGSGKQDGMYAIFNPMSYSVVPHVSGIAGLNYSRNECVKDNVTGLIWEGKMADNSFRDYRRSYTNLGDGRTGDASDYVAAVNAAWLCGKNDWRLPTVDELETLVDAGKAASPLVNADWFINSNTAYWSSSPVVGNAHGTWLVDFDLGYVQGYSRNGSVAVRLVRASQ